MNHERLFIMRMTIKFLPGIKRIQTRELCVNSNVSDTISTASTITNVTIFLFLKVDNSVLLYSVKATHERFDFTS